MECHPTNEQTNYILQYLMKMSEANPSKSLKISIEGNIASGKSTIIKYLKNKIDMSNSSQYQGPKFKFNIIPEPVNLWRNLNGNNLLDLMYSDLNKWAFPFNMYAQLTLLQNHLKMNTLNQNFDHDNKYNISIMERSIHSARYCFIENFMKSNIIHSAEYEILDKWFNWNVSSQDCSLDVIFYLKTHPETCYSRCLKRARPEEIESVNLDYLKSLHEYHENWLYNEIDKSSPLSFYRPASIIVIDANQSIDEVYKTIEYETSVLIN